MLLSMTGFGEAVAKTDELSVTAEVRSINSRFVKVSIRAGDGFGTLEPKIEAVVRGRVRRGTVQVNVRVLRLRGQDDYRINADVLKGYRSQLDEIDQQAPVRLVDLLGLPGVIAEQSSAVNLASVAWPVVSEALEAALDQLDQMRHEEGRAMGEDLRSNCREIAAQLDMVETRSPQVVANYRKRLTEKTEKALAEFDLSVESSDLIREVSLLGERSDISEEIVRLKSHLEQFETTMDAPEPSGRKLEFLTQEMVRETNTIGSKANDVQIAQHVVEMKTAMERIREMIQNVQ